MRTIAAILVVSALSGHAGAEPVDLIVLGGDVVTMDPEGRVISDGAVAVRSGEIVGVGERALLGSRYQAEETIDASGGIVLPGLINAHTHAPMVLFRGLADDLSLMDWLQDHVFPAEAAHVDPEFVRVGTRLAVAEMLLSGTTTFADMYYFEDQVAEVAREAGIRAVVGETLIGFPAPDHETVDEALRYTERFLRRWQGDPLVTAAVAPHSVYLLDPEALRACRDLADRFRAPLLIHLSEAESEQATVRERYGRTPTEHLRELGLLRPGLVAAHGVFLNAGDRSALRSAGAGVVHCPQSNMKVAVGRAPVPEMLAEGVRLGLGTDGAASNNDLDMFEEMLVAALLAKHGTGNPTAAPAAAVLEMATVGGARVLGMEDSIGSLETGRRADLVVVSLSEPRARPTYDPVSHLVYAVKGSDVRHVVVDGRVVVRDRVLLTLDVADVLAEAETLRREIAAER
jgi:5-methylthioadenosine/S-adenosylhomocysteine deaminase